MSFTSSHRVRQLVSITATAAQQLRRSQGYVPFFISRVYTRTSLLPAFSSFRYPDGHSCVFSSLEQMPCPSPLITTRLEHPPSFFQRSASGMRAGRRDTAGSIGRLVPVFQAVISSIAPLCERSNAPAAVLRKPWIAPIPILRPRSSHGRVGARRAFYVDLYS